MREVHRFIADSILLSDSFEEMVRARRCARKLEPTGRKVAVAGAGPDRPDRRLLSRPAGPRRHGLRLACPRPAACCALPCRSTACRKPVLRREIELIERLGVKFVFNTRVGFDISLNELDERFDAVFLAIGTWKESWVYLPGTELKGVYPGAAVPGSGRQGERRSAWHARWWSSAAATPPSIRRARRCAWVPSVTVVYRRERKDMPAIEEETAAAEEEGAKFVFLAAPHRIIGDAKGNVTAHSKS